MRRALFVWFVLLASAVGAQDLGLSPADRSRIAEAQRIVAESGETLWPGWQYAPFAILLVTADKEYLVNSLTRSPEFELVGQDPLLGSNVYARTRVFDPGLLATFPAVAGIPTIVIGQPENTEASTSTRWALTLAHEHFHQWQMSQPDYYTETEGLGLAKDDTTGMWMLNYPFPYDDDTVNAAFANMSRTLRDVVFAIDGRGFRGKFDAFRKARAAFKAVLSDDDYAYFSFQVWQEGIARYTEYRLARSSALHAPSASFKELPDFVPFDKQAAELKGRVMSQLLNADLEEQRRTAFYHIGAAEGILLDKVSPGWRDHYFTQKFYVENYYDLTE